jgi:hypothetical protein
MDHVDHIFGSVRDGDGEELHLGMGLLHRLDHRPSPTTGQMDIEEDNLGLTLADHLDGRRHLVGLTDQLDMAADLGPHPGPEQIVIIDEEHPDRVGHDTGMLSRTSVPDPGALITSA